jgi:hypothetical protein
MLSSSYLFQRIARANSFNGLDEPAWFLKYFLEILILTMISKYPKKPRFIFWNFDTCHDFQITQQSKIVDF